jgi:L-rhamnose mutarotase
VRPAFEGRPDQAATALTEVFHLEDQLADAGGSAASDTDNRNDTEGSAS